MALRFETINPACLNAAYVKLLVVLPLRIEQTKPIRDARTRRVGFAKSTAVRGGSDKQGHSLACSAAGIVRKLDSAHLQADLVVCSHLRRRCQDCRAVPFEFGFVNRNVVPGRRICSLRSIASRVARPKVRLQVQHKNPEFEAAGRVASRIATRTHKA